MMIIFRSLATQSVILPWLVNIYRLVKLCNSYLPCAKSNDSDIGHSDFTSKPENLILATKVKFKNKSIFRRFSSRFI